MLGQNLADAMNYIIYLQQFIIKIMQSHQDKYKQEQQAKKPKKKYKDVENEEGKTELFIAVDNGDFEKAKRLANDGARVHHKSVKNPELKTPMELCGYKIGTPSASVEDELLKSMEPKDKDGRKRGAGETGECISSGPSPFIELQNHFALAEARRRNDKINNECCSIS